MSIRGRFRAWPGLVALVASPCLAQSVSFPSPYLLSLERLPAAMAAIDLNLDGNQDLVVTHFIEQTATVLLGDGSGQFGENGEFAAGGPSIRIAVGDIDLDGASDLIFSEEESDNVWFLRSPGDGTLATPARSEPGHDPIGTALADLDGDDKLDLVVALSDEQGPEISVLRGDGSGAFSLWQTLPIPGDVEAVALADFDGDGLIDGAVSDPGRDAVQLLRGTADGPFALAGDKVETGGGAGPLALADVDTDSRIDLLVANTSDNSVTVLRNLGDGGFAPPATFPSGGRGLNGIATGDLDGDGHLDVVGSHVRSQGVDILLGRGDGTFGPPRGYVTESDPIALALVDFDRDGALDVVTANEGVGDQSPSITVIRGDGGGRFDAIEQLPGARSHAGVGVGDFDEDGRVDAVVGAPDDKALLLYRTPADDAPMVPSTIALDAAPVTLSVADLDGDSHRDVVVLKPRGMSVLYGKGDATFEIANTALDATAALVAVDFDRDGDLDLVLARAQAPLGILPLRNDGGRLLTPLSTVVGLGQITTLTSGDLDGDGFVDVVGNDVGVARLAWFRGTAEGFAAVQSVTIPSIAAAIVAADLDVNGSTDLAMALPLTRVTASILGDGTGSWIIGPQNQFDGFPGSLAVRDLNGDGLPELIIDDSLANATSIMLNRGSASFRQQTPMRSAVRAGALTTADFDGDGRYDVLAIGSTLARLTNRGEIVELRGDGNGDGTVTAADFVALLRERGDGDSEDVDLARGGSFAGARGADSDGDGQITGFDLRVLHGKVWAEP